MNTKNTAMNQIDAIYKVVQGNLRVIIPGKLMIVTGALVAAIPLIEWVFSASIDPLLVAAHAPSALIFLLRTAFYWTLFGCIGKQFSHREEKHPIIKKAWARLKYFPMIPVATAAMLAWTGHAELICPIILILVGCLFALHGEFTPPIVTITACAYILGGLAGIYLSTLQIHSLWKYLVAYQGLGMVIMGLILRHQQKHQPLELDQVQ